MPSNRSSMYKIKDLVAKGRRDYNTTNMFVSKNKLYIIDEATFKKPKLITIKSYTIRYREVEDRELIKWSTKCEMIDEMFCVGILLISCIPSILIWQWLKCKTITDILNVRRRNKLWWNNIGKKVIGNMIRHTKRKGM